MTPRSRLIIVAGLSLLAAILFVPMIEVVDMVEVCFCGQQQAWTQEGWMIGEPRFNVRVTVEGDPNHHHVYPDPWTDGARSVSFIELLRLKHASNRRTNGPS